MNFKYIVSLSKKIQNAIEKNNLELAKKLIEETLTKKEISFDVKVEIGSFYLDIAELYLRIRNEPEISKNLVHQCLSLYNKCITPNVFVLCNKARSYMILYDIDYVTKQLLVKNKNLTFDEVDSIFDIKSNISKTIRLYWEALEYTSDDSENYNIRNNLANALSRVGRSLEAINLFEQNFQHFPERWESILSWADALINYVERSKITDTPSLHLIIIEKYNHSLTLKVPPYIHQEIRTKYLFHISELSKFGISYSENRIHENRNELALEFERHTNLRRYSLINKLTLNEHSIFCSCLLSAKDDISIYSPAEKDSIKLQEKNTSLESLVNTLKSEFSFSRLLYYMYINGETIEQQDVLYTSIPIETSYGYNYEHLRTSYRIVYSVLDKIKNGIVLLFDIENTKNGSDYFEDFFDKNSEMLDKLKNRHLTALYSLAMDLNRENGAFKHYKKIRNQIEHGPKVSKLRDATTEGITKSELEDMALQLLQLTRSAILSFVFLCRTELK